MLFFRNRIRRFFEKKLYCKNTISKKCSVVLLTAQRLLYESVNRGEGKSLKFLIEFSDCEV